MAVKNVETGEIHRGYKGGKTECGFDTTDHPENWVSSTGKITCAKKGCK